MARPASRTGRPLGWRRHVVPLVFLVGVVVLLVGMARPQATIDLPRREGTVILAFDVSSSMKAKDLAPTRIAAAKRAARAFVDDQPSSIRIGVVAFSDAGYVVQPPTRSRRDVLAAVDRLSARGGTALGRGILTSLSAVAGKPIVLDRDALENGSRQPDVRFLGLVGDRAPVRRRQHRAARSGGPGAGRRAGRRAHLPDRHRQRRRCGRRHRRLPGGDRARRRPPAQRGRTQRRDVLRGDRRRRAASASTTPSTSSSRSPDATPRSPRSSPAPGCCCFLVAAGLSMRWYGRVDLMLRFLWPWALARARSSRC